ncbi:MAG: transporter permease, partial [Sphingomonas bacterium]|nr:transporter permease [Sphingomonas bacterium]
MSAEPANFTQDDRTLRFTGELILACLGDVPTRLESISPAPEAVDLSGVDRIDTVGAWIIHRLER